MNSFWQDLRFGFRMLVKNPILVITNGNEPERVIGRLVTPNFLCKPF
jgi:hypothetical protein